MKNSGLLSLLLLLIVLVTSGCNLPSEPAPLPEPADEIPDLIPEDVTLEPPPEEPTPEIVVDLWPRTTIQIDGEEEIVFDWTTDQCERENIPDLAARAYRDAEGVVSLVIAHPRAYRMTGPDLNHLTINCEPIYKSFSNPDPAIFNDKTWLASVYTADGETYYALGHNEYQGHTHPGYCPSGDYFDCWYNTITLLISTDGGTSFQPAVEPPGHYVAGLPVQYQAGDGPYGMRGPSNIIQGPDGFFYAFLSHVAEDSADQYTCAMRTKDLSDPTSWRFWDGTGYEGRFVNPYLEPDAVRAEHECPPFMLDQIGHGLHESITYNTELELYTLIGIGADTIDGREVWGFYYSFSKDLVEWTRRKLLMEMPLPWTVADPGNDLSHLYPSLLDPDSEDMNFGTTDNQAYLYFTRNNFGHASLDRDLIRVPVRFVPGGGG